MVRRYAMLSAALALTACTTHDVPVASQPGPGRETAAMAAPNFSLRAKEEDEIRAHHLNIGAGSCVVVECPGPDAPVLIADCGSTGGTDADMKKEDVVTYVGGVLGAH